MVRLNRIVLLFLLLISCEKTVEKKAIKDCKYISGGFGFTMYIDDDKISELSEVDFNRIKVDGVSKMRGKLNIEKHSDYVAKRNYLIINDTLFLIDTLIINIRNKSYKLYDFVNGGIEVSSYVTGKKFENCFLKEMKINGKIVKREEDLSFKFEL